MKIVIAPDSFKGSLSSLEACEAIKKGVLRAAPSAQTVCVPIADGGEGMLDCVRAARPDDETVTLTVTYPDGGQGTADYLLLDGGRTAVVELAQAAGLTLVAPERRDPSRTTTYGLGQLMAHALKSGVRRLVVGIGGSATNDCGMGMLQALGASFTDENGCEVGFGGAELARVERFDTSKMPDLSGVEMIAACDVTNPLCGKNGAAWVYAPQKGADDAMCALLDAAAGHFARVCGVDADRPGAGAAGGVGAALFTFLHAQPRSGIEVALELTGFSQKLQHADCVITGEGRTDSQTANGKAVWGICKAAEAAGVLPVCISGALGDCTELYQKTKAAFFAAADRPMSLADAMKNAAELLENAAYNVTRLLLR
ncbi:MAG: glycerate kinase [Clostridia bacterium]|nr:glycerate kinase [Clostridia bacterium]